MSQSQEDQAGPGAAKICPVCGRRFEWRKKWERDWPTVKFCGDACRRKGTPDATDEALERAITDLLRQRSASSTICPSEAARAVHAEAGNRLDEKNGSSNADDGWRDLMPASRFAAFRLASRGEVEIMQRGRVLSDWSRARGPIRIRLAR